MAVAIGVNQEQADYWSAEPGQKWLTHEAALDATLAPVLEQVLAQAALQPGERVLDVGCGTGASVLAVSAQVGAQGAVLGLDISDPLLRRGAVRAAGLEQARFLLADAQTHDFEPVSFDALISRFGVMFFADPAAAFANMARALRPGGRMVFAAWASLPKNPFFTIGVEVATARLGKPAPMPPGQPGPLAFQDQAMVCELLARAGLQAIRTEEVALHLTPPGTSAEVASVLSRVGPTYRIMAELNATPEDAAAIEAGMAERFATMAGPDGVQIPAAVNMFSATRA